MPGNPETLRHTLRQQNETKALYRQVFDYAMAYLDGQAEQRVFPAPEALGRLAAFDTPLPDEGEPAAAVLARLHELGAPATTGQGGGRYFGFVNGGVIPAALAARLLADVWDQNGALYVTSPIAAKLEAVCERWLVDLLALPAGSAAGFVSGTSTATLCGMVAGRNALLARRGWDVAEQGLFGAPPIRVVMSEGAHSSVRKALSIMGVGRANIEYVAADDQGRLDPRRLPPLDDNTLLLLQAGNVNSGAFDDFKTLCAVARAAGAWTHIDGAFGMWAAACAATRHLTDGAELADSWSVDGHKTLNTPYDSGVVLCADRAALVGAMQASAAYFQPSEERDGMFLTPEMSRRARGIEMWALLQALGRSGVDSLVAGMCENAQLFADRLRAADFRVLNDVVFNQVLVAGDSPAETQRILAHVQASGECWCGGSQWAGEPVIRLSVCSWATTAADIERSVAAFVTARG